MKRTYTVPILSGWIYQSNFSIRLRHGITKKSAKYNQIYHAPQHAIKPFWLPSDLKSPISLLGNNEILGFVPLLYHGPLLNIKTVFPRCADSHFKDTTTRDLLIFIMGSLYWLDEIFTLRRSSWLRRSGNIWLNSLRRMGKIDRYHPYICKAKRSMNRLIHNFQ